MQRYLFLTTTLILLLFWPIQAQEVAAPVIELPPVAQRLLTPEWELKEEKYFSQLTQLGRDLNAQGILIESLNGSVLFADHNSEVAFNPASVIKVGTSFAALMQWGPDYQFETAFYTDGVVNKKTKSLKGDLIFQSTGDPVLTLTDVKRLITQVTRSGISSVTGNLIVTGPFSVDSSYRQEAAVKKLQTALRQVGLKVSGKVQKGALTGTPVASHLSKSLRDILLTLNERSSNPTAERLGEALGGPKAVERFLIDVVGIPASDVVVSRTSGLDYNRITPRGTIQLFRQLVEWLDQRHLTPNAILPIAGVSLGTLHSRFTSNDLRGGIVGKTGTLPATDGGVSTLAGIAYTVDRGPVLFAIFNTKGSVNTYRRLQDTLLKDLIDECGGIYDISGASQISSN